MRCHPTVTDIAQYIIQPESIMQYELYAVASPGMGFGASLSENTASSSHRKTDGQE